MRQKKNNRKRDVTENNWSKIQNKSPKTTGGKGDICFNEFLDTYVYIYFVVVAWLVVFSQAN